MQHLFRKILHATDFSAESRKAFEMALALARETGAELLIVHAYQLSSLLQTDLYAAPTVYSDLDTKLRGDAENAIESLVTEARETGVAVTGAVLSGVPYDAIARKADEENVDLIVLGTHGRTGVARLFLGSVASRVISTAARPVLTVPSHS
jgi:nucleotide-binding universal stress UspA family protein